jgi:hypothetical protein
MKTLKRILLFGIIVGVTVFTSCEKDDDTKTFNKEDAEAVIETSNQSMDSVMTEMQNSESMKTMEVLGSLTTANDPFMSPSKNLSNPMLVASIKDIVNPDQLYTQKAGDSHFKFSDHTGTYSWQQDSTWDKDLDNPSDAIIIEFPSDPANYGQTGNNAVLTIDSYIEDKIVTDTGSTWIPTMLSATLEVNDTKYVDVLYELSLTDGNPSEVKMQLYLKPFTYKLNFTENSITYSLAKDGVDNTLFSGDLTFTFVSSEMEDVKKVEGNIQMKELNFKGWVKPYALGDSTNYQGIESYEDIAENMNEQMDIKVHKFDTGDKLANLVFAVDETSNYSIMGSIVIAFEFKDGTTKDAGPYFNEVITKIESMMNELSSNDL